MRNEISAHVILDAVVSGIFESGTEAVIDGSFYEQLHDLVEQDSTTLKTPFDLIETTTVPGTRLLDFGCGTGAHEDFAKSRGYEWWGINYKEGMAAGVREAFSHNERIFAYDGLNIPFADSHFDVVWSIQVFEHIQSIDGTFKDLHRVLKPGGSIIGSVSYLEQFHDYSTFNFTPFGLKLAAERAGLRLVKVYPMFDVFTWMLRRLLIVTSASDDNSLSPSLKGDNEIGAAFVAYGERLGLSAVRTNLLRLLFSSHFTFRIDKPLA